MVCHNTVGINFATENFGEREKNVQKAATG